MNPPLILGGGVAGIAAAVELADAGLKPILIESRPYLGGRVRSFLHERTGDRIDNGQHLLMGCYHETLALLRRLGTDSLLELQPELHVDFRNLRGESWSLSAPRLLPASLGLLIGMVRFKALSVTDRLRLIRVGLDLKGKGPRPSETVDAYLTRLGQSQAALGLLWDPIILATLNTPPAKASAALFAQVMRLGFFGSGEDSRLILPTVGLSELLEPAEQLIAAKGGTVLKGSPVAGIERRSPVFEVVLRNGTTLRSERVISALPWRSASRLIGPLGAGEAPKASTPPHNPIVSIYLWFDRDLSHVPRFCATPGMIVEWVFNRRRIVAEPNSRYPGLLSCVISAAADELVHDSARLVEQTVADLRRGFPELEGASLTDFQVIAEKQATFSAQPDVEQLRPGPVGSVPGLFIAGDWTDTSLPGTIESGVRSGRTAARELLRSHR